MIKNIIFKFFILGSFILLLSSCVNQPIRLYIPNEQKEIPLQTKQKPIEFIYTAQELEEISKWKNQTIEKLMGDAISGNRAALYNIGMFFLLGLNVPINVESANLYFAKSASLGFAPALDKLAHMYIEDKPNIFLVLVYKNLTISFGHNEFINAYYDFRNQILEKFGQKIMSKIEKIAIHKSSIILKNQDGFQKTENKTKFFRSLHNITFKDDYKYNASYWLKLYQKTS